nr:RNA-dependent RNA polymerase [Marmot picobirnavirus]
MIKGLSKEIKQTINHNKNLSRYLFNLTQEQPPTKRSWLYESKDPDAILLEWKNHLAVLENGDSFEKEVFQFDTSQEEKWGPQGGHPQISELMDDVVLPSYKTIKPSPQVFSEDISGYFGNGHQTPDWKQAINRVNRENLAAGIHGLRPASYKSVIDDMRARDTLESNSGYPDFARRNLPEVKSAAIHAAETWSYREFPAIALFRTYRGKTRLVWMFPMATNLVEAQYYQPAQSAFIKSGLPFYAPWNGFEHVRDLISQAYDNGKFIAASDFSATDAHFKWATTEQANDVLWPCFVKESRIGLYNSLKHMHQIPLLIGPNEMLTGWHGVASGSNWTNFVETVFDRVFSVYVEGKLNNGYQGFYAIGDDMAWVSDKYDPSFKIYLEELGLEVGQEVKAEKTTNYPDKVKSLQRLFQRGYKRPDGKVRAVYSTIRALNSSVYPEKFHNPKLWSSDMFCARQYMILENCVDHPLFEDFVRFIVHGQKDLIPFAKKSAHELNKIMRETKLLPGLNPTYNQERRDQSLSTFESIRIASKI